MNPTSLTPLIGATGRRLDGSVMTTASGFQDAPVEAYFEEYTAAIHRAGGLAVNLPAGAPVHALADLLNGLVLSGGGDVDPGLYGGNAQHPSLSGVDRSRDHFELDLVTAMIERGKPVLGICRGAQVLNVSCGGTLVADLPRGTGDDHGSYAFPRAHRRHVVHLQPGSLAHTLYGPHAWVNSFHHQAVDRVGQGLAVSGRASDGVPEVIELPGLPVLGVQWHPEALDEDPAFAWLVRCARAGNDVHPRADEAIA